MAICTFKAILCFFWFGLVLFLSCFSLCVCVGGGGGGVGGSHFPIVMSTWASELLNTLQDLILMCPCGFICHVSGVVIS